MKILVFFSLLIGIVVLACSGSATRISTVQPATKSQPAVTSQPTTTPTITSPISQAVATTSTPTPVPTLAAAVLPTPVPTLAATVLPTSVPTLSPTIDPTPVLNSSPGSTPKPTKGPIDTTVIAPTSVTTNLPTLLAVCHKILPNEIVTSETCFERMQQGLDPKLGLLYGLEWVSSNSDLVDDWDIKYSGLKFFSESAQINSEGFRSKGSSSKNFLTQNLSSREPYNTTVKISYPPGAYYGFSDPLSVTINPATRLPKIDVSPQDTPIFAYTPEIGFDWLTPSHSSDFIELRPPMARSKWIGGDTHPTVRNRLTQALYLFDATFTDGSTIEVRVDPEIKKTDNQAALAKKYLHTVGQLPGFLRKGIKTFSIYKTDYWRQDRHRAASHMDGHINLHLEMVRPLSVEEVIFHEGVHTIDHFHQHEGQWLAAQKNDGQFVSRYAEQNPRTEDIAESYPMYYVSRIHNPQLPVSIVNTIISTIPNRIQYFDAYLPLPESITTPSEDDQTDSYVGCDGSRLEYEDEGKKLYNDRDFQNAIAQFTKAISLEPNSCDSYYLRAKAYYEQTMYEAAIADFDVAIELGPNEAKHYASRSKAHKKLNNDIQTLNDRNKAIELDESDADLWALRGYQYHDLKDYKSAISDFDMAISINPEYPYYYIRRGLSYNWLGSGSLATRTGRENAATNNEKAISDFTKAIELDPSNADAYAHRSNSYDWVISATGDQSFVNYRLMVKDQKKACSLDSNYC